MNADEQAAANARALELALGHHRAGHIAEAEEIYRCVLASDPCSHDALHLLGLVELERGAHERAATLLEDAVRLCPAAPDFLNNLGEAYRALGRAADAERCYRAALGFRPGYPEAHSNLGALLHNLGRLEEAERSCRQAVALGPGLAMAHNNLAVVLCRLGRPEAAEPFARQALELGPRQAAAHFSLGNVLKSLGRLDEAEQCYRAALGIDSNYAEALNNLADVLKIGGRLDDAAHCYREGMALGPAQAEVHSNLIGTMDLMESCDAREQQEERRRWHLRHAAQYAAAIRPHDNDPDPERRLHIGYVSADFCRHSAYYAFGAVVRNHDPAAFEVTCYSGVQVEDEITSFLRQSVQRWRSTVGVSDDALAEQIRSDRIDLLIDLSGHSAGNRLLAFARKPAPVQVTAWGYPTGTGLKTIDYFLADPVWIPQSERPLYAEEVIDLPSVLCYQPPDFLSAVSPLPAVGGGPLTFGCVNRIEKISDRAIALWGRIFVALPAAQLLLKDRTLDAARVREQLLARLQRAGIAPSRVRLEGFSLHRDHLKIYHEVDLGLDPYPHGGGVSTLEALWMGVPVVTLSGPTIASRATASILSTIGMPEWIAQSDDNYVRIAVAAAQDLERLSRVRQCLRASASASPLGDVKGYVSAVQSTYRTLWRRWCKRQ